MTYYTVQPISKEPLSAADQAIKDSVDFDDLKRRVTPPLPEAVQKRIDKINGVSSEGAEAAPAPAAQKAAKAKAAKAAPAAVSMSEEEDESFPAYDGQATNN
jgi:hypothetical protein